MTCREYEDLLLKKMEGTLTPQEEAEMRDHEKACPQCRSLMESAEDLERDLEGLGAVPPVPADFHEAWMGAVRKETNMMQKQNKAPRNWKRLLAAAAAVVFVLVGTIATKDRLQVPKVRSSQTSAYTEDAMSGGGLVARNAAPMASSKMADYESAAAYEMDEMAMDMAMEAPTTGSMMPADKKIIRTANLTIRTKEFEESLDALTQLCQENGGWISSKSVSTSGNGLQRAYLTFRVPSSSMDAFLEGTSGAGRITQMDETADDVTEMYNDTKTRLATQKAMMERLQALVGTAAKLSDLLELESQIADTQYTIDSLEQSLRSTDRKVDYATINLTLQEERKEDTVVEKVSLLERLKAALEIGLEAFGEALTDMLLFIVAALPFLACVLVLYLIVRFVLRRRRARRKAVQTEEKESQK